MQKVFVAIGGTGHKLSALWAGEGFRMLSAFAAYADTAIHLIDPLPRPVERRRYSSIAFGRKRFDSPVRLDFTPRLVVDSFRPNLVPITLAFERGLLAGRRILFSTDFDPRDLGYVSNGERAINQCMDKTLPLSFWSLMRSFSDSARGRTRPYCSFFDDGYRSFDPDIWELVRGDIPENGPLSILGSADLQIDTSPVVHSTNTHSHASRVLSHKGMGSAVSRKPTTLPQRK
jgi:hypothetical protein